MTDPFDFSQFDTADVAVAEFVAVEVREMMTRAVTTAIEHGTEITTSQILGAVLAFGMAMSPDPITREDYLKVYDAVVALREKAANLVAGPEATAHAANSDEAGELAERWGQKISDVAFDFGDL